MTLAGFAPGVEEKLGYYVYLLIDPRNQEVFYVGKGMGDRCFAHIVEARTTEADSVGDYAKLTRIREIEQSGSDVRVDILRHGLTEREAFLIEASAIDLLGQEQLHNRVLGVGAATGRTSVGDINAVYGAKPVTIAPEHRVVLIRIARLFERGMTQDELYEATRKWWPVSPIRRQPGSPFAPRWAMAVYGGVVRAVYRIEGWEPPSAAVIAEDPKRRRRWAFRGEPDPAMEALYLHGNVWTYLRNPATGRASQFPLRYVNCEVLMSDELVQDVS